MPDDERDPNYCYVHEVVEPPPAPEPPKEES